MVILSHENIEHWRKYAVAKDGVCGKKDSIASIHYIKMAPSGELCMQIRVLYIKLYSEMS